MSIKKLAGQTAWYGVSAIMSRFLVYLLTPYLTGHMTTAVYGEMSIVYAAIPFMNVIFTYGMETTFFRFSNKEYNQQHIYNIGTISLFTTTIIFASVLLLFKQPLAHLLGVEGHPQFITWSVYIIALDAVTRLPFARLRNDGRPRKYAFVVMASILTHISLVLFFYTVLPKLALHHPTTVFATMWDPKLGTGYYIIANLVASGLTLLLLSKEILSVRLDWDSKLFREMLTYSYPLIIVGFGGVINETFDRIMLRWWLSAPTETAKIAEVGIYSACYKLSLLITLFVQAFRMGAEPFFFQQARGDNAQKIYARVMKFFVITICVMFLFITLFLDVWKYFIRNREMWEGLKVVPVLLIANMCIGVYYSLAIWYKLANRNMAGATITFIGSAVTLVVNYFFIPRYSYMASAWATMLCYATMMVISYTWGQKVYPVPYPRKKLTSFFAVMLLFYFIYRLVAHFAHPVWIHLSVGLVLWLAYLRLVLVVERKEIKNLPYIGKWVHA